MKWGDADELSILRNALSTVAEADARFGRLVDQREDADKLLQEIERLTRDQAREIVLARVLAEQLAQTTAIAPRST